ncbi:magnesium transporter [Hathewaya limosa]|uniref:Magnesium transporter MgtE n=1 Tax=Hathewaya limosa TaxID=1536 RepID=A0ABU0JWB4_HATLI|nr:magnesium transporter [Hathewaya limosa]MDQ0480551.1 magnesium transporter [Hathewaya limosa]
MEKVLELLKSNRLVEARDELINKNVVDIAQLLEEVESNELLIIFRILPKDIASEVFSHIPSEQKKYIIESITDREISGIMDELFLDDTVDFIEEMPATVVKRVLKNTDEHKRKLINQYLRYPENSAGSIMTIEYVDLKKEMTVRQAINYIKETGVNKETINICYVIDNNRELDGIVSIRDLILSDEEAKLEDIMYTNIIYVNTLDDQEEVAALFRKYDFISMPVVDKEKRLVGIITIDDVVDIIEEENTEDFHKMAAIEPSEEPYLKTGVFKLAKHRIIWLLVLMISATFTGNIIKKFNDVLQSVVVLAAFIPMLMDTGGNAGSQSSTLVIRGLALGEIELKDIFKVVWKELRVSLIVGIVLSLANFVRIYYLEGTSFKIAVTVSISLVSTVILAKVVGGVLPIIAKKFKLDPAIMASPLITTIVDAFALIIYFTTATILLGI